jgi:hypothetical protein
MNTSASNERQNELATTMQSIVESENSLVSIFSKAAEELVKIQSSAWASGLNENMIALTPTPIPQNPVFLLWQLPNLMQVKAKRRVENWQDSYVIVSRSQQQLLDWACQSLLGNVTQTSAAVSRINGVLISRRQSAEVINFPDRRVQTVLAGASSHQGKSKDAQRMARQAAA